MKQTRSLKTLLLLTGLFCLACLTSFGQEKAATLYTPTVNAAPGERIEIPILLRNEAGAQVAALQFDISYDASQVEIHELKAGKVSLAADKQLMFRFLPPTASATEAASTGSPSPLETRRVILSGLNNRIILDGPIGTLILSVKETARARAVRFLFSNANAAGPHAERISLKHATGQIRIDAGKGRDHEKP